MCGLSTKTLEPIAFARALFEVSYTMTLPQLHYAIFSAAKIDYENASADYKCLS